MARGFAFPRSFLRQGAPRHKVERDFRAIETWINDVFAGHAGFKPYHTPFKFRGRGDLPVILNRNWTHLVIYLNAMVQTVPALAGVKEFASWPPFRGSGDRFNRTYNKNMQALVTYLNTHIAPNL